ncbi:hypothetical protein HanRHA438_Chr15g0697521 [Helianthus annuus]|nr:hypothetical protein HanPSC8_Chr15g0657371 [Helianthus annuus]KAJ0844001.1 hypothetical protein HanRHA438_Chr15g0697521 [Helianthus annuus]
MVVKQQRRRKQPRADDNNGYLGFQVLADGGDSSREDLAADSRDGDWNSGKASHLHVVKST